MMVGNTISYSTNGNIESKSDAGTFSYDVANRVSEIQPYYNIPAATQLVTYKPFNKVADITEETWKAEFTYGPSGQRNKMLLKEAGILKKTKYYGADYEKEVDIVMGSVRELCYVTGPDGNYIAIIEKKDGVEKTYYTLTDYLRSITHIIHDGLVLEERSYDAWGRYRNPTTWVPIAPTAVVSNFDRGYTGHEYLPKFGIINMNGRLYDPVMGRLFSADPYIQKIDNTQNFNRYSYVLKNPLRYKDPNGELVFEFLVGYIDGFFRQSGSFSDRMHGAWMGAKNKINTSGNILAGQFAGNIKQIMSRHLFEFFQNGIGMSSMLVMNIFKPDLKATHYDGATVVTGLSANRKSPGDAITMGSYIYGNSNQLWAGIDNQLFMHEYGHYLQSQESGPLFMYKYGIPSALTGTPFGFDGNHQDFWVEQDANTRAWEYFSSKKGLQNWDDTIDPRGDKRSVKWWEPLGYALNSLNIIRIK